MNQRKIIILGSSGSIGTNTLAVIDHLNRSKQGNFQVVGLSARSSAKKLIEQAKKYNVKNIAIADKAYKSEIQKALPDANIFSGADASKNLVEETDASDLAAAVVGFAGLSATIAAIYKGMRISLSNKETLVAAGSLVMPMVEKYNAKLLPVDSEHSAIFQCLNQHPKTQVKRIVLTASGGPFRSSSKEEIENATVEQALNHPTWAMGNKISIDSASMMNKALEIIEARWLFNMEPGQIEAIVHPQSIIHSFVEFIDNSTLAQLGPPDMRTPIQYALTYPDRGTGCDTAMNWNNLSKLTFEPVDTERFGAMRLAYDVIKSGNSAGVIFNSANEAAVAAFLERKVRFGRIVELVEQSLSAIDNKPLDSLETAIEIDEKTRQYVEQLVVDN